MLEKLSKAEGAATRDSNVLAAVCGEILALLPAASPLNRVAESALLIDDLGIDSLKFVDLTVRLERALGLAEFPMQDWIDAQGASGRPLSVGELALACQNLLR